MRSRHVRAGIVLGAGWISLCCAAPVSAQAPVSRSESGAEAATSARAAASASPQVRDAAREAYNQALDAFNKGDYPAAYKGFLEAWSRQGEPRIPKIAGNLGRAALKLGKHRDAAEHLAYFLHNEEDLADKDKTELNRQLAEARLHVVELRVEPGQPGASIFVDGAFVGRAPLDHALHVEPGRRKIAARHGELRAEKVLDLRAGTSEAVTLHLAPPKKEAPTPPTPPSSSPARTVFLGTGLGLSALTLGIGIGAAVASASKGGAQGQYEHVGFGPDEERAWNALEEDRVFLANLSQAMFAVGGVALLGTAGVFFSGLGTRPDTHDPRGAARPALRAAFTGTGFVVSGAW